MLAKSWNYAFMDSLIMLAKSSYYALARGDTYHFVVLMDRPRRIMLVIFGNYASTASKSGTLC